MFDIFLLKLEIISLLVMTTHRDVTEILMCDDNLLSVMSQSIKW